MTKRSAIDCIQPAIELTKQRLFRPWSYSAWWRIALLGVFAGELPGGGGNFNYPAPATSHSGNQFANPDAGLYLMLALCVGATLLFVVLGLMYVSSVLRFVLFDAVLTGRCRIRQGWRMWRDRAIPYFRLQVLIMVGFLAGLAVFVGIPIGLIWSRSGMHPGNWNGSTFMLIGIAAILSILWIICGATFAVLSKDFVVPMMALEGLNYSDAWSRLASMIGTEKKSYVYYILMKIVLTIAGSVMLGIAALIAVVALLIPLGILGGVVYLVFHAQLSGAAGIAALVVAVIVLIALLIATVILLSAPLSVFYPAYSVSFFAGRYEPLYTALYPPPPAPPIEPAPAPAL